MSKTVVITGAAKGIGKAIAKTFAYSGYNVCINYNTSEEEELKALAAEGLFDQELISIGSESERNTATAYFTQKLSDECANNGITFMSIFDQMIDTNMKTDVSFIRKNYIEQ